MQADHQEMPTQAVHLPKKLVLDNKKDKLNVDNKCKTQNKPEIEDQKLQGTRPSTPPCRGIRSKYMSSPKLTTIMNKKNKSNKPKIVRAESAGVTRLISKFETGHSPLKLPHPTHTSTPSQVGAFNARKITKPSLEENSVGKPSTWNESQPEQLEK